MVTWVLWSLFKLICYTLLFLVIVMVAPGIPPHNVKWNMLTPPEKMALVGPLKENSLLEKAEVLSTEVDRCTINEFKGPEAFAFKDNYVYTGIVGGDIVRMDLNQRERWEHFFKLGTGEHEWQEAANGRVLGLRFDHGGNNLVVADAYLGIYKIDMKSKKAETLVAKETSVDGRRLNFFNSVAPAKDGTVYYTSSTDFDLSEGLLWMITGPSGRMLKYDPKTKTSETLLDDLYFANGIALSDNEDYLLVNDLVRTRVLKYHLRGSKKGQTEVLLRTPGYPDNLVAIGKDRFMVGLFGQSDKDGDHPMETILKKPLFRKLLVRILYAMSRLPRFLNNILPLTVFEKISHSVVNMASYVDYSPTRGIVIEFDGKTGKVLKTWQSPKGSKMSHFAEAHLHDGWIYLGSPYNRFAARLPHK